MIELKNISVTFEKKGQKIQAVKDVDLTIKKGEVFGIVGFSGAGKSTLVRVINRLQQPTSGEVWVEGENITHISSKELREKRKTIGMIFQHFNLMSSRTIFDNVDFSLRYSGKSKQERHQKVTELLELVGLEDKHHAYPSELSGGQKQRVAIARALANDPDILLCDEATSALDPKTTQQILALLKKLNLTLDLTIVLITHEMAVVKEVCHKVAVMENGVIVEQADSVTLFSRAEKEVSKNFIRTASHIDEALNIILTSEQFKNDKNDVWLAELSYVGSQTNEPIISQLYSLFSVTANILYGNVEMIQGIPLGSLIVSLSGGLVNRQAAVSYLEKNNVRVKMIKGEDQYKEQGGKLNDINIA